MNKFLLALSLLLTVVDGVAQKTKAFHATVFDEDNNPVARGLFKSATDSGIIILVDELAVFINAVEIKILKIEKNPSRTEFLKLGTSAAGEVASYLINKGSNADSSGMDDVEQNLLTETHDQLFQRIQTLIQSIINGSDDVAAFNIDNSNEKFIKKLNLLQQYSIDKEIIVWKDFQNQELEKGNGDLPGITIQSNSSISGNANAAPSKTSLSLGRGYYFINKPIVKPAPAKPDQLKGKDTTPGHIKTKSTTELLKGDKTEPVKTPARKKE